MTGPAAEVAAVRTAVRRALDDIGCPSGTPVLVACSGGADSTALAAAAAYLGRARATTTAASSTTATSRTLAASRTPVASSTAERHRPVFGAVVDHGLQPGSARRAEDTAAMLEGLGIPTRVLTVAVTGPGGVEAAARRARYAALSAARPTAQSPVLLGHTLDDQAETVLLGLGRGSGARSMAGMASYDAPWLRPLLGVRRATTRAACAAQGLEVWDDPHNADPRFTRVRLRHEVLPLLEDVLAGGVAGALARTAAQLAEDLAALDEVAATARAVVERAAGEGAVVPPHCWEPDAKALSAFPPAVRRRVLRAWLLDAGVPELSDARLRAADDLVGRWHGQGAVALRGGVELARERGRLTLRRSRAVTDRDGP